MIFKRIRLHRPHLKGRFSYPGELWRRLQRRRADAAAWIAELDACRR